MTSDSRLNIAVLGAGRMGQAVVQRIERTPGCAVAGIWARGSDSSLTELLDTADVAVDFTLAGALPRITEAVVETGTPLVCGVTGLGDDGLAAISVAAKAAPVLYDRNMSLGVAVMSLLLQQAQSALGASYAIEIRETHHVHKKDAPSGTAIALREALEDENIPIDSVRQGDVVGEHQVRFSTGLEALEITHRALDRSVFAEGALRAARWLSRQSAGLYCMADLFSETDSRL